ncbi:glycosyltransferase family 2 protein [Nocardioides bruguierae]|uniref:glycosyltransferase family 2 protein n=1 Tax=Nocardioides bruguierae TaxID=2945102 RepID=UPI003557C878
MAAHNEEGTIGDSIQSILAESSVDLELLVCADGCTDGTLDIVREAAERDARVRVFANRTALGSGASRNRLIREARGTYLAVQDADDISLPGRLAKQMNIISGDSALTLVAGSARILDTAGVRAEERLLPVASPQEAVRMLRQGRMPFVHPTVLLKRDAALQCGGYDVACVRAQDLALMLRLNLSESEIAIVDDSLVMYRLPGQRSLGAIARNLKGRRLAIQRNSSGVSLPGRLFALGPLWMIRVIPTWLVERHRWRRR